MNVKHSGDSLYIVHVYFMIIVLVLQLYFAYSSCNICIMYHFNFLFSDFDPICNLDMRGLIVCFIHLSEKIVVNQCMQLLRS